MEKLGTMSFIFLNESCCIPSQLCLGECRLPEKKRVTVLHLLPIVVSDSFPRCQWQICIALMRIVIFDIETPFIEIFCVMLTRLCGPCVDYTLISQWFYYYFFLLISLSQSLVMAIVFFFFFNFSIEVKLFFSWK